MPVPPTNPQDTQAVIVVFVAIAAGFCVVHWRIALRAIIILVLAFAIYGAVVGIHGVSSLVTAHHH